MSTRYPYWHKPYSELSRRYRVLVPGAYGVVFVASVAEGSLCAYGSTPKSMHHFLGHNPRALSAVWGQLPPAWAWDWLCASGLVRPDLYHTVSP